LERSDLSGHSEEVRALLERFPDDEFLARDQFLDFINGHGFRSTLLCHDAVELRRDLSPARLSNFHLASSLADAGSGPDLETPDEVEFKSDSGATLATNHALTKAALRVLGSRWPVAIGCDDLIAQALADTPAVRDAEPAHRAEEIERTQQALLTAALAGHIFLFMEPPMMVAAAGEHPEVSAFARKQAEQGTIVTNLRHARVKLEDERVRRLILLTDGTRDIDRLVADLAAATQSIPAAANDEPINRASVLKRLNELARMALLVR
jgi:methyltransferase-like protein